MADHRPSSRHSHQRVLSSGISRLLIAAALIHITLAVGLNVAGRFQVAPNLIDPSGIMPSFALDSYTYQRAGTVLAAVVRREGVRVLLTEDEPIHIKLISLQFLLFEPFFGNGPLSNELLNLFCYLLTLWLVFAIARELGGSRVGLIATGVVAVWPTFLLHNTQLLKEPLFIAGSLAFILIVTTTLTRTYTRRTALIVSLVTAGAATLILRVRFQFGVILLGAVIFGLVLLLVRQLLEKRLLFWNLACPLLVLAVAALSPLYMTGSIEKFKQYSTADVGPSKSVGTMLQIPGTFNYAHSMSEKQLAQRDAGSGLSEFTRGATLDLYATRHNYNVDVSESGSGVDQDVEFKSISDVLRYVPRAFEVGMWAPFPNTWARKGKYVGNGGVMVAAAETAIIYLCQLFAVIALVSGPKKIAAVLLAMLSIFGLTMLGLVVSNVGTLYRFRYIFWILLIILAAKGLCEVAAFVRRRGSTSKASPSLSESPMVVAASSGKNR